jgi:hypothetical protein
MGEAPAFDMMLGIMVGSIVSRAITGNAPLVPALAATATLIALHLRPDGGCMPLAWPWRDDKGAGTHASSSEGRQGRVGKANRRPHQPQP